jgi:hypothetical protein
MLESIDRISDELFIVDLKRAPMPFDLCKLDLMGHRWPEVMAIQVKVDYAIYFRKKIC